MSADPCLVYHLQHSLGCWEFHHDEMVMEVAAEGVVAEFISGRRGIDLQSLRREDLLVVALYVDHEHRHNSACRP